MEGRQLTKCGFHSGKYYCQLLAFACRKSVPRANSLSSVGKVEKFMSGDCGSEHKILLVEKVQPICHQRVERMSHGDIQLCRPSTVLRIEEKILSVTQYIGRLLCPAVSLQTVLKVLNPFGHSWNMLQDEDSEGQDECQETSSYKDIHYMHLGPMTD